MNDNYKATMAAVESLFHYTRAGAETAIKEIRSGEYDKNVRELMENRAAEIEQHLAILTKYMDSRG